MSCIVLQDIEKYYKQKKVISCLNLIINSGEFIVIVGASGSGKSTLLRMIAGLEPVSSGTIFIDDEVVTHKEPGQRDIAMVFQNYALYPHMNVYKNMSYGLKVRGKSKKFIKERVDEIAELLQIKHLIYSKPSNLSGGQRQRVAMGRAIIRNPKIFLFDEPLSNLDAKLRVDMRLEIKKLQKKLGVTSIYVTHDQVEAMTMADKIIVMNAGNIDQIGTSKDIYQKPETLFVAEFMGSPSINLLGGKIVKEGVQLTDHNILSMNMHESTIGDDIILGIRPEHLLLREKHNTDMDIIFKVNTVEHLGAETLLYGTIENRAERLTVKTSGYWQGTIGETIHLHIARKHIHLFNPKTTKRIAIKR